MHGRTGPAATQPPVARSATRGAVAWVDHLSALVAHRAADGTAVVTTLGRGTAVPDDDPTFLTRIADVIDDADRVVILGPGDMRTRLEREYVTIWHRPDRLVDVEPSGPVGAEDLLARLRNLEGPANATGRARS
jgi:hypothetical protein